MPPFILQLETLTFTLAHNLLLSLSLFLSLRATSPTSSPSSGPWSSHRYPSTLFTSASTSTHTYTHTPAAVTIDISNISPQWQVVRRRARATSANSLRITMSVHHESMSKWPVFLYFQFSLSLSLTYRAAQVLVVVICRNTFKPFFFALPLILMFILFFFFALLQVQIIGFNSDLYSSVALAAKNPNGLVSISLLIQVTAKLMRASQLAFSLLPGYHWPGLLRKGGEVKGKRAQNLRDTEMQVMIHFSLRHLSSELLSLH